ncbi:MAG: hypothetical protein PHP16_06150 [Eubacteriales bacterium]|nr:hypothetical protein [Eubacteriales bacterium]
MNDHSFSQKAIEAHRLWQGKIEVNSRVPVDSMDALSIAYTPGVAAPCLEIKDDVNKSYDYTRRWNMCLVVTDGSVV